MIAPNPSASYFEKIDSQWDDLPSGYFTEGVAQPWFNGKFE